jgi:oligopeptidase A
MNNPLLEMSDLPAFDLIRAEYVEPALDAVLTNARTAIEALIEFDQVHDWDTLMAPLESVQDALNQVWSPVSHLNAVVNNEALRAAYNACLPKLTEFHTELGQNEALYRAVRQVADSSDALDGAQRAVLEHALRDFHLSGVDLPPDKKQRYKAVLQELSALQSKFQDNVLDATGAWRKHLTDPAALAGLPESAMSAARQDAQRAGLDGWLLTLDFPCYLPVMSYAEDPGLRREMYEAFVTRASELGPDAGQYDNTQLMEQILCLRHEAAQLLGFDSYAERSLATKMAADPTQVLAFLDDLAIRSRPQAQREFAELTAFAAQHGGVDRLNGWDVSYYAEKLRLHRYDISQEALRPYFPENRVVPGLFSVVERLYGVTIKPRTGVAVWHPDVRFYDVLDRDGVIRAHCYVDLYARAHKRGGAWMADFRGRRKLADGSQTPVAYITCNFTPPVGDSPALFTHNEVVTLFHEFGHGLHHMLTQVDCLEVSGINGVEWDAVELPSQFMENWCWEREALDLLSGHVETGEPIPDALYQRMIDAKHFQSGMQMVRQLEFALFDFRLHAEYQPESGARVMDIWSQVRDRVAVVPSAAFNRFPNAFTHIFSGGYAAGYYSYKWAEVLSADAFSRFEEDGIFNADTGRAFLNEVLAVGGARKAMDSFVAFRGRAPSIEPLLRHSGIAVQAA